MLGRIPFTSQRGFEMGRLRTFGALIVAGLTAGLVWTGVAVAAPLPCADILPLSSVSKGDIGVGWTVRQGTDPEPFDAEVLGVMPDLIAPGRDVIIVEISGPVVDTGGGVWAGMSGSPVYIDHGGGPELAGALAYGFSFGATNIAGLTPAEDMIKLNGLAVAPKVPARLKLSRSMVRKVAAKIGAALPTVGGSLVRLKVPVSVSGGLSNERFRQMKKLPFFKKYKPTMRLTPGASSSASLSGVVDDLVPGGNFSAALSYGALTVAGVGTTTFVCDGQALAFGHPMLFNGKTTLGAGSADAMAIVPDALGPYKLANVTNPVGTLDQDRLAGIRAVDGAPPFIPITTLLTSVDNENTDATETDVVFNEAFPDLAFSHIFSSIDSVFDKIGSGSASYNWTIEGKREDGTPWEFHKTNSYVSEFDLSFESAFEIYGELLAIANFPNEKIEFTSVDATINLEETVRKYDLEKLLWCHGGSCEKVRRIRSHPGATLKFRAILNPSEEGLPNKKVNIRLTIPQSARGGAAVTVGGGSGCDPFALLFGECGGGADTFDDLLASFEGQPNNVLVAQLLTGRRGKVSDEVDTLEDKVISGSAAISITFPGQCCPPPTGGFDEGFFFFRHA
jgi:hypothetical protein